jgi:hypothetical protein
MYCKHKREYLHMCKKCDFEKVNYFNEGKYTFVLSLVYNNLHIKPIPWWRKLWFEFFYRNGGNGQPGLGKQTKDMDGHGKYTSLANIYNGDMRIYTLQKAKVLVLNLGHFRLNSRKDNIHGTSSYCKVFLRLGTKSSEEGQSFCYP